MKRLMYIECKTNGHRGPAHIGWVELSRSARSYYYRGKRLEKTGAGYKYNCFDSETGERYWVSGPKRNGGDRLYGGIVQIDEDAREEYWLHIRRQPQYRSLTQYRS